MTYRHMVTDVPKVDMALTDMARMINQLLGDVAKNRVEFNDYKNAAEKKFKMMTESITTKTLLVGDVAAGNYIEIKETGEIETHGTNTIQINSGVLYIQNGATLMRIRIDSGVYYVENQNGASWDELFSAF